jgi:hypothetical protein
MHINKHIVYEEKKVVIIKYYKKQMTTNISITFNLMFISSSYHRLKRK